MVSLFQFGPKIGKLIYRELGIPGVHSLWVVHSKPLEVGRPFGTGNRQQQAVRVHRLGHIRHLESDDEKQWHHLWFLGQMIGAQFPANSGTFCWQNINLICIFLP